MTPAADAQTRELWRARVERFPRRPAINAGRRWRAAVAIAIVADERDDPAFLLTRRSSRLRNHPGQYALPGGTVDAGESDVAAACRELHEELGVVATAADVLGQLDDYATRSGFVMCPVVLWLADRSFELEPSQDEVEAVYTVPVTELGVEPLFVQIAESPRPVIRLPLLGRFVHAPTAAILHQCGELLVHDRVTRVAEYEQPLFAWR